MKKQNENGRISEDRLSRANKRKKNNTIASILVMTGCLLVLVLVTYVAGILYSWIDSKFQDNANDLAAAAEAGSQTEGAAEAVKTYTQEEVDALIAEAKQQAEDEEENKILSGIRDGLISGTTMVETLRPYYPDELVVVSNGTFNFVPINENLQKNDYVLENLNILEDGEVQYMQDGQVVSHKGIDVSKHQGNIDWTKVAADGVEFAFIRVGLRGYGTEGKLVEDEYILYTHTDNTDHHYNKRTTYHRIPAGTGLTSGCPSPCCGRSWACNRHPEQSGRTARSGGFSLPRSDHWRVPCRRLLSPHRRRWEVQHCKALPSLIPDSPLPTVLHP